MTVQVCDTLVHHGQEYVLNCLPLESCKLPRPEFDSMSTACWRGYIGRWEVRRDRLCLINLYGPTHNQDRDAVEEMFPGCGGVAEAVWFSGEVAPVRHDADSPFFLLLVQRGEVLLEQKFAESGGITESRLTAAALALVDARERGFVQAIHADPRDAAVRMIYADWLDEQNDPRGELLRADVKQFEASGFVDPGARVPPRFWLGFGPRDGFVASANQLWFWRRLAGIPVPTPEVEEMR
jgi:uncharacterized protein (TIGR02996 family)